MRLYLIPEVGFEEKTFSKAHCSKNTDSSILVLTWALITYITSPDLISLSYPPSALTVCVCASSLGFDFSHETRCGPKLSRCLKVAARAQLANFSSVISARGDLRRGTRHALSGAHDSLADAALESRWNPTPPQQISRLASTTLSRALPRIQASPSTSADLYAYVL